jgi:hypothetical protein
MAVFKCTTIEARLDGSGDIAYDIWACDNDGIEIPGRHKTIVVPGAEVRAAEALVSDKLRNAEHKRLLQVYAGPGWDDATLTSIIATNKEANEIATSVNERLLLPVSFIL